MRLPEFEAAYVAQAPLLFSLGATVERILQELLEVSGISTLSINHRLKTLESAVLKFAKYVEPIPAFEDMTDVLGLRIITYLRDDVDKVAALFQDEFEIDQPNSVDKRAVLDPDRFGYLSLHYVASLSDTRTAITEYKKFKGVRFEVQIRSVLQHAWAEIEHDLGYKSTSAVPREERRAFSRLAGLLEMADDEFVRIRDRLEVHQQATEDEIARGDRDIEIDQDSIFALVRAGEPTVDRMDRAIARFAVGADATNSEPTRLYAGSRAEELRYLGLTTVAQGLDALSGAEHEILSFARHWLELDYPGAADLPDHDESHDWEDNLWLDLTDVPVRDANDHDAPVLDPDDEPDSQFESGRRVRGQVYRATPATLASLDWPRGVSLFYLYLYIGAERSLGKYLESRTWDESTSLNDRAQAACLAAARGLDAIPFE